MSAFWWECGPHVLTETCRAAFKLQQEASELLVDVLGPAGLAFRESAEVAAFLPPPVRHHAKLAHGEGEEGTDRKQRDQPVCHAPKNDQQGARSDR